MDPWALPEIDRGKCTRCGLCIQTCPAQALKLTDAGPVFIAPESCTYCTQCETLCPVSAVTCEFEIVWREK